MVRASALGLELDAGVRFQSLLLEKQRDLLETLSSERSAEAEALARRRDLFGGAR